MSRQIDYYFSHISPWAYIGHQLFLDIAKKHDATIRYKPVSLMELFPQTGGLPLGKRHPARQSYRWLELQRWRERRGLTFNLKPAHWPFDMSLADRLAIAADQAGHDVADLTTRILCAVFEQERNAADEAVLAALLSEAGLSASLLEAAKAPAAEKIYTDHFDEAVAAGVFGSPAYVLNGEVFWGQDRLDFVEDALRSGRAPYLSLA